MNQEEIIKEAILDVLGEDVDIIFTLADQIAMQVEGLADLRRRLIDYERKLEQIANTLKDIPKTPSSSY